MNLNDVFRLAEGMLATRPPDCMCHTCKLAQALLALRAVHAACDRLRTAWLDTSGSHASVDAITDGCHDIVAAIDALAAKETP